MEGNGRQKNVCSMTALGLNPALNICPWRDLYKVPRDWLIEIYMLKSDLRNRYKNKLFISKLIK